MNWFGTTRVTKDEPRAATALRTREVFKTGQGCHTCNRTDQQHASSSSVSSNASDEDETFQSGAGQQVTTLFSRYELMAFKEV
jgi:hypothetical protein